RGNGPIDPKRILMLLHRLHVRGDGRVTGIRLGGAEIHVFDETGVHTWRGTAGRTTAAEWVGRCDRAKVRIIQVVNAVMPVVAAEGAARQAHLHDVKKLTVTGVDFDLAVV